MSVLDESATNAVGEAGGGRRPFAPSVCPECLTAFHAQGRPRLFCCDEHKRAFHNRTTVRGLRLTPLSMAARQTRGGTRGNTEVGKAARGDAEQLIAQWTCEDAAAGRMSMTDYIAERRRRGY